MSKNKKIYKPKAIHSTRYNGFVGTILTEEMYQDVKYGRKDWDAHVKMKMTAVTIPIEVFHRLLKMDRTITTIPFEGEITFKGGAD